MGRASVEAARPPMWHIEDVRGAERAVRFGKHRIALSHITGISLEEVRTRNVKGLVTGAFAFFCVSGTLAYFVVEQGAMLRLLFGGLFLTGLGLSGLHEALTMRQISHYELMLTLADGRRVVFTSTDRADIQALALRIAAERGE